MSPEDLSLVEAVDAIRTGTLSPVEYVRALFARMDKVEPRVQAWATVNREAVLEEAWQCDIEARTKQFRGPLHGIPIGIKDIFYTKDLRTTMGSSAFADFIPDYDAAVVQRLKQAGALVLGKCVTTVLIFLDPGPTRNPWNTDHTPGGSSSGSAAAVAARMCPVAIGSQTVGSVGRPGGYNGVASLVPTQSRISREGVFPLAWSLDHVGAFARSAADLELLLDSLTDSKANGSPAVATSKTFRIGVVRDFFFANADAETRAAINGLGIKLDNSGFSVLEAKLPAIFELAQPILRIILRAEAAAVHETLVCKKPESYGPKLRELVHLGMLLDSGAYLKARRLRRHYQREMAKLFQHFDVLLTPAAPGPAPKGIAATGNPLMNAPWALADFPTMTLPFALSSEGLPLGIQLSAAPLQERLLLEAAKAVESVIGFTARPDL